SAAPVTSPRSSMRWRIVRTWLLSASICAWPAGVLAEGQLTQSASRFSICISCASSETGIRATAACWEPACAWPCVPEAEAPGAPESPGAPEAPDRVEPAADAVADAACTGADTGAGAGAGALTGVIVIVVDVLMALNMAALTSP